MKVSLIKSNKDKHSFNFAKSIGMNVIELEQNEEVDNVIEELVNDEYKSIILSNEIAGFSEDIIKKYANNKQVKIYIAPSKRI